MLPDSTNNSRNNKSPIKIGKTATPPNFNISHIVIGFYKRFSVLISTLLTKVANNQFLA